MTLPVLPDAFRGVGHVEVGVLHQVPDAAQLALDLIKLGLDGLQLLPLLGGDPIHLLVHDLDQFGDVGLGEDVLPYPLHHHLLEASCVEPGGRASVLAPLHDGLADVVGELAALGVLA
ncbi:MAG: hypothetical protein OXL35_06210 [Chloroflexota bacterium]|nr:hypothetical protein [Chloroflexota bacterium]